MKKLKNFFLKGDPIKLSSGAIITPILSLAKKGIRQNIIAEQLERLRQEDCEEEEYCLDFCARRDLFAFSCENCPYSFSKNKKKKGEKMENIVRRQIPLQKFKAGDKIVLRSDRIAGRPKCRIETVKEILPNGLIRLKGREGKFYPNHWERA